MTRHCLKFDGCWVFALVIIRVDLRCDDHATSYDHAIFIPSCNIHITMPYSLDNTRFIHCLWFLITLGREYCLYMFSWVNWSWWWGSIGIFLVFAWHFATVYINQLLIHPLSIQIVLSWHLRLCSDDAALLDVWRLLSYRVSNWKNRPITLCKDSRALTVLGYLSGVQIGLPFWVSNRNLDVYNRQGRLRRPLGKIFFLVFFSLTVMAMV